MRNFFIPGLLIASSLMLTAGCNEPPQHQVVMNSPPIPEIQPDNQPKLKEIRPLDTGEPEVFQPLHGEDPPTISEVTATPENDSFNMYWVKRGDTFWKIAKTQFGDGQRWREIAKLNPNVDKNKLRVGQPIRLPEK